MRLIETCLTALSIIHKNLVWPLVLFFPCVAFAGAWSPEAGSGQIITTLSYYSISNLTDYGSNVSTKKFHKTELSLYTEIGITDSLTLGACPRFQAQSSSPETLSGEIFLRKKLWQNEHAVLSIQPLFQLPGAYSTSSYSMLDDPNYAQAELRGLAGYSNSYHTIPFFWDGELAYRRALDGSSQEWHMDHSLGIKIFPRWMVMLQLFNTYRPEGITENAIITSSDGWGNTNTLQYPIFHSYFDTITQISVVHPLTNTISIQVGTFSHIVEGKEWLGNGVLVSLWMNF